MKAEEMQVILSRDHPDQAFALKVPAWIGGQLGNRILFSFDGQKADDFSYTRYVRSGEKRTKKFTLKVRSVSKHFGRKGEIDILE